MSNIKEPYSISVWEEELIPAQDWYVLKENEVEIDRISKDEFKDLQDKLSFTLRENFNVDTYINTAEQTCITASQYAQLTSAEQAKYQISTIEKAYVKDGRYMLVSDYEKLEKRTYELHTVMEHFEETEGVIIGAHDMDSVYKAVNPILKKNVNGSVDLTFGLYYNPFDPDVMDNMRNPFIGLLSNEAKVKLLFRDKWYDLVVKNCVEDSVNSIFNYTCKSLYINELNKNGFKVELDTELENNQAVITELAETILLDTDWQVMPIKPDNTPENDTTPYSDVLVETKVEPLYIGTLNQDIKVKLLNDYIPDQFADGISDQPGISPDTRGQEITIEQGTEVLFFYSDIADNKRHPQILCRWGTYSNNSETQWKPMNPYLFNIPLEDPNRGLINPENLADNWDRDGYVTDLNGDTIINAYNYEVLTDVFYVDSEVDFNIPNITTEALEIYDAARGEKVIKSQRSGYDPDLEKFIFKYYHKNDDNQIVEYYGYSKMQVLTSDLAQNYLANSDNFTTLEAGWYFDGVPAKTIKTKGKVKTAAHSGQLFVKSDPTLSDKNQQTGQESVLVLQLRNPGTDAEYYADNYGEFYLTKEAVYVTIIENSILTSEAREFITQKAKQEKPDINNEELAKILTDIQEGNEDEKFKEYKYSYNHKCYYKDLEGNYYQTEAPEYNATDSPNGKAYEDNVRSFIYDNREYGLEGYADKTDDELDDIINEILMSKRYSKRSRYAINNGVAANRKAIESLTPGEEFLFAVSLGKFVEDEKGNTIIPPANYGDEIKYGAKTPSEFYEFFPAGQHKEFIQKAVSKALDETKKAIVADPLQYYLQHPEYEKVYTETYKKETKKAEKEYEEKFLFGLNTVNADARDNWRSGGIRYKELFLQYLRGHDEDKNPITFNYEGKEIKICEYIAEKLYDYCVDGDEESICKSIYEIFISGREYVRNPNDPEIGQWYYQGMYPMMVLNTVIDAKAKQDEFWTINSRWEPMGYDEAQFPVFDEQTQDIVTTMTSFNEALFGAFYRGIKDCYVTNDGDAHIWNDTLKAWQKKGSREAAIKYGTDEIESLLKTLYKAAYEEGRFLKVYDQAKEYKMPGTQYPEGGVIYRAYKARWEEEARKTAQAAADECNIQSLFQAPEVLSIIAAKDSYNNESTKSSYDFIIKLTNFIEDKTNSFKSGYSFEQVGTEEYNRALKLKYVAWMGEFLKENNNNNNSQYFYANFLPPFLKYWVSEQEIGTYVLAEDKYELNGGGKLQEVDFGTTVTTGNGTTLVPQLGEINTNKLTNPTAKHFVQGLYSTSATDAQYAAIKTEYNPYTATEEDEAGGYVFDRNEEVIRLFDPERDMIGATYKPIKSDDGDYIFDVFEQVYRPFRNWSVEEKRNPVTFEEDDVLGVFGDVTKHPVKFFDGHLGSWEETPTRYRMARLREDPEGSNYQYLPREIKIREVGYHNGTTYPYVNKYPAGYQTDVYIPDEFGKYVKSRDVKKPRNAKLFLKLFGEDALWELHGLTDEEVQKVEKVTSNKTFGERVRDWWKNLFTKEDTDADAEDLACAVTDQNRNNESGLMLSDATTDSETGSESGSYNEDRPSITTYTTSDGYTLSSPQIDDIENEAETKNALDKQLITEASDDEVTSERVVEAERYIKYKWYYWRHWFKDRYNYQPKICVQKNTNGVTVYKPFNNVEDKISDDYTVVPVGQVGTQTVAFYLKAPSRQYRSARELDYGTRKYRMDLQEKKSKEYWIESPNGENYLRHYKTGDGEIKLFDGHFGKWVECFKENQRDAAETLEEDWAESEEYPGLLEKEINGKKVRILPEFYLHYNDIMIPWDARVFNRDQRFTRQRTGYNKTNEDNLYVYSDGIYMTLEDYYKNNGFVGKLSYDDLTISFVKDFEYNATSFSISNIPDETTKQEFLQFKLNDDNREGQIDLVVSTNPETGEITKERWVYWKSAVKNQLSLTKDPLQTFGMLFETSRVADIEQGNEVESYPFLGMQMFRYIPYEKKATNLTEELLIPIEKNKENIKELYKSLSTSSSYWESKNDQGVITPATSLEEAAEYFYFNASSRYNNYKPGSSSSELYYLAETYKVLIRSAYTKLFGFNDEERKPTKLYTSSKGEVLNRLEQDSQSASMIIKLFSSLGYECVFVFDHDEANKNSSYYNYYITRIYKINETPEVVPLFPGEAPDARDLMRLLYYIYDPEKVTDTENVVYEYVGTKPLYDQYENPEGDFIPAYDEKCQKIRSIKGKESNYFKLLQDCCDTFDCWIEPIIEHDKETGRVKYIEKPIYTQNNVEQGEEPQIYVGQDAKEKALDEKIKWYETRFGYDSDEPYGRRIDKTTKYFIISPVYVINKDGVEVLDYENSEKDFNKITEITYTKRESIEVLDENGEVIMIPVEGSEEPAMTIKMEEVKFTKEQEYELEELNRLANININLSCQYMVVPDKKIRFKRYVGEENWNGFKYGVNLKHIKRTIDSNQISTRVIVKPNRNEYAENTSCTIQRAHDNPIKENFLLDFSYYVQQKLLNNSDLVGDLYTGVNTKLNYYNKLARLNKDNDKLIERQSSLRIDLNEVTANYETAILKRDAAIEEIQKAALTLTSSYDTYGQIFDTPWTYNKAQEFETRKQTSAPAVTFNTIAQNSLDETFNIIIDIPKTATAVDYPKYNDALRSVLDQMDVYQREYENSVAAINKYGPEKEAMEQEIHEISVQLRIIAEKKIELNKLFYHKYSRFIQEGSWVDENYIDDNLYYLDALSVMRTSCKPKITYDIGVVDIAAAVEYEEDRFVLESELGDRTYVEDIEFFGYQNDGITPYLEMVVVSEKTYNLEDASLNQTKIKNYTTQFDDLFQRIAATSQTLQFNEGSYNRAAGIINDEGAISADLLQKTIDSSDFIIANSINEEVSWDNTGITVISTEERANVLKIVSRGILISNDGGNSYKTAITGNGINADLLTAGRIDTKMLLIGNSSNPNFFWNELGISAFSVQNSLIDYSSFVRLDQYGVYGIKNWNNGKDSTRMNFNDAFAPRSIKEISNNPSAVFGLTWDGFFLNASNGTGKVTIGTEQDFKMSEFSVSENKWLDKVIIGRLSDKNGNEYYGFRLNNNENQTVMETNDSGELYLKRQLRISNFSDSETYNSLEYIYAPENPIGGYQEYYRQYTSENGQNIVKYYTVDSFTLITTEETDVDWRELIEKPEDRVTLGVVDVYKRNAENYVKVLTPKGVYSSIDFLTKVFSVKANGRVNNKQFNEIDIQTLIADNENFAVFDNGNLYAKNAWIEGHIQATSGEFTGKITAEEGQITGRLEIGANNTSGNIFSSGANGKGGWAINGDGTAYFNDVMVSGKISTAIFEQEKVQTIAGGMLVCPAVTVLNHINNLVVLDATGEVPGIEVDAILQIGNQLGGTKVKITSVTYKTQEEYDKLVRDFENETSGEGDITLNGDITTDGAGNVEILPGDEQEQPEEDEPNVEINENNGKLVCIEIVPLSAEDGFETLTKGDVLLILSYGSVQAENYGISINSRRAGAGSDEYPSQSIAIINLRETSQSPKALFGYLGSVQNEMDFEFSELSSSYGLYCDNAYLKGTLISVTKNEDDQITNIAGLTSTNAVEVRFPGASESEYAAFFAGQSKENLSFYVTKKGKLYATDGYFSGIIYASKIVGNHSVEQQPALTIEAEDIKKAIVFQKEEQNKITEYLSIEQAGSFFYSKENSSGIKETLGAFIHTTDNNEFGFGLFQKDGRKDQLVNYLLNFKKEVNSDNEDIVRMYYGAQPLVTITNKEFIIEGKSGSGLGDSCFVEDVIVANKTVGVDFLLKLS